MGTLAPSQSLVMTDDSPWLAARTADPGGGRGRLARRRSNAGMGCNRGRQPAAADSVVVVAHNLLVVEAAQERAAKATASASACFAPHAKSEVMSSRQLGQLGCGCDGPVVGCLRPSLCVSKQKPSQSAAGAGG